MRKGRGFAALAVLLLLSGCVSTAGSQGPVVSDPTVGEFAGLLHDFGHKTRIDTDNSGDPMLLVNEGGDNFVVFFYDCKGSGGAADRRCTGAELNVSYPVKKKITLARINDINRNYRLAKAYLKDGKDPALSMTLNIGGTFTGGHVSDSLEWWQVAMRGFEEDIGWKQ